MDILNPDIEQIDGCYYRINPIDGFSFGKNVENLPYQEFDDEVEDEDKFAEERPLDEDEEIPNLIQRDDGFFVVNLHVASIYLPVIIGKRGATQVRLERETKAFIRIPRRNESGDIIIRSKRKEAVAAAYRRIQILVNAARRKQNYTHFISIPLKSETIKERFLHFQKSVVENFSSDRGIRDDLFLQTEKLHLTVETMTLADNVERSIAIDTLRRCKEMFIDPVHLDKPIRVLVKGLEIMNDDPSEVRVLYGKILTEDNSLQKLVDNIARFFSTTGLTGALRECVKLHATLMNARFVALRTKDMEMQDHTFDARNILKNFENYEFGEILIDTMCLSQSHTKGEDGYYETSSRITFYSSDAA